MKLSNTDEQRQAGAQGAAKEIGAAVDAAYATGRPIRVALTQKDLVRAIRAAAERLQRCGKDALTRNRAQAEVRADLSIMGLLSDREARRSAAASMAGTMDQQLAYRFELEVQSPELAREVEDAADTGAHRERATEAGERHSPVDCLGKARESVPVAVTMPAGRNRVASNEVCTPARPDA